MALIDLVTPLGSNFLKDFPAQNAVNMDRIDAYAKASKLSSSLKTYTPNFTTTSGTPSIGTGGPAILRGFYYEIFDFVYVWGEMRFGTSGGTAGNGIWGFSLPSSANSSIGATTSLGDTPIVGTASLWRNASGADRQHATVHLRSSNQIQFGVRTNAGTTAREVSHNWPFVWANSDGITWNARYLRVP